jgi:hypothetical protein
MFNTCTNCPTQHACEAIGRCEKELTEAGHLEIMASLIWQKTYPERREWHKLEQSAKDEWIRFTKIAQDVIGNYKRNADVEY